MKKIFILLFPLFLTCCTDRKDTQFSKLGRSATGIDFRNRLEESEELNVLNYVYFYNGAGVAVGDVNNDGLQDLFFAGNMVKNRLFLNKGGFEFKDITQQARVAEKQGWCTGATMADVNGDGWLDIYVCRSADVRPDMRRNLLFINNKDLTFTERGDEYGLDDPGYSTHAAFFDADRDGDLDLFLLNHSLSEYTGVKLEMTQWKEKKEPAFSSKFYRNNGGRYEDLSEAAGITGNVLSFGLGLGISDVNGDDWPDVYVCNDFNEQDYLFVNKGAGSDGQWAGGFTDRLPDYFDHVSLFSMGCDWADLNNDGRPELVTVDMLPEDNHTQKMHMGAENYNKFQAMFSRGFYYQYSRNMLHRNNGDGTFSEIGQLSGISNTDWSWAALGADFDNDGWKDLFVSNGYVKDYTDMDFLKYTADQAQSGRGGQKAGSAAALLKKMKGSELSNYLFQNHGDLTFQNVAAQWGLGDKNWTYGAAYADLDNDGDLDLVASNINEYASVYRNNSESKNLNNWLKIRLESPDLKGNAFAVGTKVQVWAGGRQYYQEMMPSRGYASSVDYNLTFGLGGVAEVDSILLIWPDASRQKIGATPVRQTLVVQKNTSGVLRRPPDFSGLSNLESLSSGDVLFAPAAPPPFAHRENPDQVDFKTQTLLPHFLSRSGPCLAQADVNGDGLTDLYAGGAKGWEGGLLLGTRTGSFALQPCPAFAPDKGSEDTGAAFFDADGDGDVDLYVVSGGYAFAPDDPALQDRLYRNDGRGNFSKTDGALPGERGSGSCVRPADVDGDGDFDLFVGGRVTPGRYPETPESRLLINDGKGKFENKTAELAPGLARAGMVTDAAWVDLDSDKSPELILVGEWMPIRVFDNKNGRFTENPARAPAAAGGWWNCLRAEDLDGDGDLDLVAGNLGLNTQIRADANRPATLDYADFDGNGSIDPLFSWYIGNKSHPAAFRDDLAEQLPVVKKKFTDYKSYADAGRADLFAPEQMAKAQQLRAEEFRTCIFENQGGKFVLKPLPLEAQYAPVYAVLCFDADGDGVQDLLLAGNQRHTRIRFGRYDANHGILFLGDGKGGFRYAPQHVSGLKIRGDVRSLALIKQGGRISVVFGVNDGYLAKYMVK